MKILTGDPITILNKHVAKKLTVELHNKAHHDTDDTKFNFKVSGRLETCEDVPDSFYVRINEGYYGPSGITFPIRQVTELEESSDGHLIIILK